MGSCGLVRIIVRIFSYLWVIKLWLHLLRIPVPRTLSVLRSIRIVGLGVNLVMLIIGGLEVQTVCIRV